MKRSLLHVRWGKPPPVRALPSVQESEFPARQFACGLHQPRGWRQCTRPASSTTSNCVRRVQLAHAAPQLLFRVAYAYVWLHLCEFPGPEFQRRADRILTRSERAFRVSLLILLVVFLCLYPGFVERLIAAIPLSLFILSLKDQVRIWYESWRSSFSIIRHARPSAQVSADDTSLSSLIGKKNGAEN